MTTIADTLRRNLPRLHKAGIATDLDNRFSSEVWWLNTGDDGMRHVSPGIAVTYAIGAIVEHCIGKGRCLNLGFHRENDALGELIEYLDDAGLIAPLEPTHE